MSAENVAVILPAFNEVSCVKKVVEGFLSEVQRVLVVDNGSTDGTGQVAAKAGAEVVYEGRRGYGNACLAGISHLTSHPPDIVVFADCDGTLDPHDLSNLIFPIIHGSADLVLGRRAWVEKGALPPHQKLGNGIACLLLRILYGLAIKDIPPYRVVRWSFLAGLNLSEKTYGFPAETVARARIRGGRIEEVKVAYRIRTGGRSKVAGSIAGSLKAGATMMAVLLSVRFRRSTI